VRVLMDFATAMPPNLIGGWAATEKNLTDGIAVGLMKSRIPLGQRLGTQEHRLRRVGEIIVAQCVLRRRYPFHILPSAPHSPLFCRARHYTNRVLKNPVSRPELRRTYDVCAIYKSALSCDVRPTTGGDSHGNDKSKRGGADRRRVARGQAYEAGCGKTRFKPLITVWLEVRALPGPPLFRNRIGSVRHFALLPTPRP